MNVASRIHSIAHKRGIFVSIVITKSGFNVLIDAVYVRLPRKNMRNVHWVRNIKSHLGEI